MHLKLLSAAYNCLTLLTNLSTEACLDPEKGGGVGTGGPDPPEKSHKYRGS